MTTKQSRVTVVGAHKRVDVSLPATAPVGEYSALLAGLCGQEDVDMLPSAWSLAVAGDEAFPLEATLAEMGVSDGQVLYLRDIATEPGDPPVVEDVDEIVATQTQMIRQERAHGGPVVVGIGLVWLLVAGVSGVVWTGGATLAAALVGAGILMIATSWAMAQHRTRTVAPRFVRAIVLLTPVPCLALAGLLVAQVLGSPQFRWEGAVIGGNLGALLALLAAPEALLAAVQVQMITAFGVVLLIRGFGANSTGGAAIASVAAVALLSLAHRTASAAVAWNARIPRDDGPAAANANALVHRSHRMVAAVLAGPLAALVVGLARLALAGNVFALGLAVAIGVALLIRSHQAAFTVEVAGFGGVAAIDFFCLLVRATRAGGGSPATTMALLVLVGPLIVLGGLLFCAYGAKTPHPPAGPVGTPRKPTPWRRRAEGLGVAMSIAMTPLALGTFGVYGQLLQFGRHLF
jgi:ESX secretion system protein EccD